MNKQQIALIVGDGLIGHDGLNRLIPRMLQIGLQPVIYNAHNTVTKKGSIAELDDIKFYGTSLLQDVVLPYLDEKPPLLNNDGTLIEGLQYSLQHLVQLYDLEYHDIPDVNNQDFIENIIADDYLVGSISFRMYQIFKPETIAVLEEKGFLWNLHTGALPEYKGVHIPYRCIENGEAEYGWTLHYIEKGIDTGDIIAVDTLPLDYNKPILDSYLDMVEKGVNLITRELKSYKESGLLPKAKPQTDQEKQSYYTYPTAREMAKYDAMGIRFVDVSKVVDMYVSRFSLPNTTHAQQLRMRAIEAIGGWEQDKDYTSGEPIIEYQSDDLSFG